MNKSKGFMLASITIALMIITCTIIIFNYASTKDGEEMYEYKGHGGTFKNTIAEMDTPDPSMVYKDGFYYLTFTHNGTDIMVMKSRTIDFKQAQRKVVWYPPVNTMYSAELWAPEIQWIDNSWYIYFAADDGKNENHRMYALQAVSDDPMGEYEFIGKIDDGSDKWAIDGLVMEHKGELYFVWSGWEGDVNISQNTYIAPMSDPVTISGPRVKISEPTLDWEKAGGPPYIQEGQAILKRNDKRYIAYSGAGSWTPFYSIGLLQLKEEGNPLNPEHWTKIDQPLLTMDETAGVYGPGHNSFVQSPDGTEDWLVYHATSHINDGWNNRKGRAQRLEWDEHDFPMIGKPLALTTAISVPSSEGLYLAPYAQVSNGTYVFEQIPASQDDVYPLLIQYDNVLSSAHLKVAVNDVEVANEKLAQTESDKPSYHWLRIPLSKGSNSIRIVTEEGITLQAIEITRFEAEDAEETEGAHAEQNPFASGTGIAIGDEARSGKVTFSNVVVPQGGDYQLALGVSNRNHEVETLELKINGSDSMKVSIEPGDRAIFNQHTIKATLQAGQNNISLVNLPSYMAIDYMDVLK